MVDKWQKYELDGSIVMMKPEVFKLSQFGESNKKSKKEGEDWMTAIEFLKTKVTYERFINKFGQVKFNLNNTDQQVSGNLARLSNLT